MSLQVAALGSGLVGPEAAVGLPLAEPGARLEVTHINVTDSVARGSSFFLNDADIWRNIW